MVASRRRDLVSLKSGYGYHSYNHFDLENGNARSRPSQPRLRFRDAVEATIDQNRAHHMKDLLLTSMDHEAMEKFRKRDEEV